MKECDHKMAMRALRACRNAYELGEVRRSLLLIGKWSDEVAQCYEEICDEGQTLPD